jgi:RHS repeat-associated protein
MTAAKEELHVFSLAAFRLFGEKPRLGHQLLTAALHQGVGPINSSTTTGIAASLYDFRGRPRSTGKERDSESGLDYFGARYLSSAQGRFTSPDTPFNDQDPSDPQSWNLYGYVRNNPLSSVDPTGEDCVSIISQSGTSISVGIATGDCGSRGGISVNGTVDQDSLRYEGNSLDFSYIDYGGAVGVLSKNLGAPVYDFPGIEGPANRAGMARIGASQLLINEFAKQAAYQAIGRLAGHLVGAGIDAALAARAATAPEATLDLGLLAPKPQLQSPKGWRLKRLKQIPRREKCCKQDSTITRAFRRGTRAWARRTFIFSRALRQWNAVLWQRMKAWREARNDDHRGATQNHVGSTEPDRH